jgi:CDP-diacylglycerol--serine O-phosphatidyltransferase
MNYLANLLTVLSLVCGFASIIFSLEQQFTFACWAIILSVIFDGLDGQIARRNPIPNEFGKELDSLVDVVSFGIAPSILGYIFIYHDFYIPASIALFIYLFCSVMRLAKYNITPKEKLANYFYGLPTTVSGGMLASFVLIFRNKHTGLILGYIPLIFLLVVLSLAFLMVSRVKYLNLDGLKEIFAKQVKAVVLLAVAIFLLAASFKKAGITLFSSFLIYLVFSPWAVERLKNKL